MEAKIYDKSATLNGVVNYEKLDLEIIASPIQNYITPAYEFKGKIFVEFEQKPSSEDVTSLDAIIAAHDGQKADVSKALKEERSITIDKLSQLALYHPLLTRVETAAYLASIDDEINQFIRIGISNTLWDRIEADRQPGQPFEVYLNTVTNPNNGQLAYEFFQQKLPAKEA